MSEAEAGVEQAQRREALRSAFRARFGREPSHWVRAPGRVDAMGSHTDYNEGFVLTLPIDRDTWIAAAPRGDGRVHVESLNVEGAGEFPIGAVLSERTATWALYVQAVAEMLVREGYALSGCDVLVHGTLPIASGLSSSASLEAATAVLFAELGGYEIEGVRMARLCQLAENDAGSWISTAPSWARRARPCCSTAETCATSRRPFPRAFARSSATPGRAASSPGPSTASAAAPARRACGC